MRKVGLAGGLAAALALVGGVASAQSQGRRSSSSGGGGRMPAMRPQVQTQQQTTSGPVTAHGAAGGDLQAGTVSTLRRERLGSYAAADSARARARSGDCAGALPLFDDALATIQDPTLNRDRGLCHEALNDPYPAIDDYRVYLYGMPDAPDSDDIRARLERLEAHVGEGGPSPYSTTDANGDVVGSGNGTSSRTSTAQTYDSVKDEEQDASSPLRRGRGWVLAPVLGVRNWFFASGTSSSNVSENVGARLSWVLDDTNSFLVELGYERFDDSGAEAITVSGLTTQIAYEARLPFNRDTDIDNLWILGAGVGYEHLVFGNVPQALGITVPSIGGVGPRARAGYRHNFSRSSAFEATLDGGLSFFFTYDGESPPTKATPWLGLNLALLFAL